VKYYDPFRAARRLFRTVASLAVAAALSIALSVSPARAQDSAGTDRPRTVYGSADDPDAGSYSSSRPYGNGSSRMRDVLTVILPALGGAGVGAIVGGKRGAFIGAGAGAGVGGVFVYRRHRNRRPFPLPTRSPFSDASRGAASGQR
jgi:hypothetical protein